MYTLSNAASFIDRLVTLLVPRIELMLPLHANLSSTAVAQFRLVGNLLSKLLGWGHFSLDHTLPAQ